MLLSQTEENYLKAIYLLSYEDNNQPIEVSTNDIAKKIDISAASVSDMLKKLSQKTLIHYEKYQGVKLTEEGKKLAINIIRKHRLWETFLVDKLNFKWDEVHEVAEQLEHINSKLLIQRLDEFLGSPKYDPHGDPIPDKDGFFQQDIGDCIHQYAIGNKVEVRSVKENAPLFLQFLDKVGIGIGTTMIILDKIKYDQSIEVDINNHKVILSKEVSDKIYVNQL
ncbi:MAG: metal-dependent transcriptional regulator [Thermonemataceae bacterium]